jgi:hypothetical protein
LQEQNQKLEKALVASAKKAQPITEPNAIHPHTYFIQQNKIARMAVTGMIRYAADHDNNFPTGFDEAESYYASDPLKTNLNGFEITYRGPLTNIANPSTAIVVQSIQPWLTTNTEEKAYGFADGHSETHGVPIGGSFNEWEQKYSPILLHP